MSAASILQVTHDAPRADDWNTLVWTPADRTRTGRQLIILNEINWMGMQDTTFLGKLKNAWDMHFAKTPRLILILSGSVSSWIERNILHHTGFLCRVSLDLTLSECPRHLQSVLGEERHRVTPYETLRLLAVTGGVPRYLEEVNPALSADANIQRMCLSPEGLLFNEFDNIFTDLFSSRNTTYRRLVAALVDGPLELDGLNFSGKRALALVIAGSTERQGYDRQSEQQDRQGYRMFVREITADSKFHSRSRSRRLCRPDLRLSPHSDARLRSEVELITRFHVPERLIPSVQVAHDAIHTGHPRAVRIAQHQRAQLLVAIQRSPHLRPGEKSRHLSG